MESVNDFFAPLDIPLLGEESVLNLNKAIAKNEILNALKTMGKDKRRKLNLIQAFNIGKTCVCVCVCVCVGLCMCEWYGVRMDVCDNLR